MTKTMAEITQQDLIELAEFCGWRWRCVHDGNVWSWTSPGVAITPCKTKEQIEDLFKPHTDANDCEALIRALNEAGWAITVTRYVDAEPGFCLVEMYEDDDFTHKYLGNDYKLGVCELALKVIRDEGR